MTLEPLLPDLDEDENPELRDFQRRFWWTLPLTAIVFVLAMFGHRLQWMDMTVQSWVELVAGTCTEQYRHHTFMRCERHFANFLRHQGSSQIKA